MSKKAIIAIAIAAIVVIAGVAILANTLFKGDEHNTDYTLMDSIKTDGIKAGLHYIVEEKGKGYSTKSTWQSAEKDPGEMYYFFALETESRYSDCTSEFDNLDFKSVYFDYVQYATTAPTGVTVTTDKDGSGNDVYTIDGKGTIKDDYLNDRTVEFKQMKICVTMMGDPVYVKGECSVKGKLDVYVAQYDLNISEKYTSDDDIKCVKNGSRTVNTSKHFDTADDFITEVFDKFSEATYSSVITDAKDVSYKGVNAREVSIDGTMMGDTVKGTVHHYKGYTLDTSLKVNGDDFSKNVEIYYVNI